MTPTDALTDSTATPVEHAITIIGSAVPPPAEPVPPPSSPTGSQSTTAPVSSTGPLVPALATNSTFGSIKATVNAKTGAITFTASFANPGTFSWLLTFQNGKFGFYTASTAKCKKGFVRLGGKCRPAKIVFAKGSRAVAAAGTVTFTIKPTASGLKALKTAKRQKKGLPLSEAFTFQSSLGGSPVAHTQTLMAKLKK
jgi:hypothetical protein